MASDARGGETLLVYSQLLDGHFRNLNWRYLLNFRGYVTKYGFIEGSLEVKLPTKWTDEAAPGGKRMEETEEKQSEEKKSEEKDSVERNQGARKGRRVTKRCVFPMFCGPGGLKSRLAKAAGGEIKKCTPLWREADLEVKMLKTTHFRSTLGSWDVEKVHPSAARSSFRSQNATKTPLSEHSWKFNKCTLLRREAHVEAKIFKSTSWSDHFWTLRCRKSARRCGAKHISTSTCENNITLGPLLDVEPSKEIS